VKLDIYINYPGTCADAFRFYEAHLGARITMMMKHGELPESRVPAEFRDKVLHAQLELAGSVIRGADIPNAEPMRSAYVNLSLDSAAEAERVYALLTVNGQIFMKMEETFFATRFAMLRDRFGTSWMLMHQRES
jgi:PhnB protein